MSLEIQPGIAQSRYHRLAQQVREQFPRPDGHCVVTSTGVKTAPFDSGYESADLFLGSHVDSDPKTEDKIHVLSYHKEPSQTEGGGGETILEECFTERQERPHLFSRQTQVLHAYALKYHSPGGNLLEAALASLDLRTGEVLRQETGGRALDDIQRLGLDRRIQ